MANDAELERRVAMLEVALADVASAAERMARILADDFLGLPLPGEPRKTIEMRNVRAGLVAAAEEFAIIQTRFLPKR